MRARTLLTRLRRAYRHIWPLRRPKRMYSNGRPPVDAFVPTERLYRRFNRDHVVDNQIVVAALSFPNTGENSGQSVNRSQFSEPQDVLWQDHIEERYDGWGVFAFPVSCLPAEITCHDTARRYTFFPKHVPLERNYAHSEIWCDTLPRSNASYVKPTASVRKKLRALIWQHIQVIRQPRG